MKRRTFLGGLGLSALSSSFPSGGWGSAEGTSTTPPVLTNPNMLIIMVDQLRAPRFLSSAQQQTLNRSYLPNISAIRNSSFQFNRCTTAATVCTASRGAFLTGLYPQQTYVMVGDEGADRPATPLLAQFPTFGDAIPTLNPAYRGNMNWFGKWHLSATDVADPLRAFGFNTRTYPSQLYPDPIGYINEGATGGQYESSYYANDQDITNDFVAWLGDQGFGSPWLSVVSLINPHDVNEANDWLQQTPGSIPPGGESKQIWFYPPKLPPAGVAALFGPTQLPNPWNWETPQSGIKPDMQIQAALDEGAQQDWSDFMNNYYFLQHLVDIQIGTVLGALASSSFADNTIVIFLSDHGEYAGSHGLKGKGWAAYEESISVPLYVKFPRQGGPVVMPQMCSTVDLFGLFCDLATEGAGTWRTAYPDLANRESLWNFMQGRQESYRLWYPPSGAPVPYIWHTCDRPCPGPGGINNHIRAFRTKTKSSNPTFPGAKLATYSQWGECAVSPIPGAVQQTEYYSYDPATTNNWLEMGNDYTAASEQNRIDDYLQATGLLGSQTSGLVTDLTAPLIGTGTDGTPLSSAQAIALQNYLNYTYGSCSASRRRAPR
jgi:arylsulfatase A-like enzyme